MQQSSSPFEAFKYPVFRMLWSIALVTNVCMWMSDVSVAWLMTSLTLEPVWVALVQTAVTGPMLLLGLPSGALADILDRRRYLLATQCWLATTALLLCLALVLDLMTAPLLLVLTFLNGIGLAMRWPIYAALIPESVPRSELSQALALNGVSMNASRIAGPLLAGVLIASAGIVWVFAFNAALSAVSAFVVWRWRREQTPEPLGREGLISAMRVGAQFVRESPVLHGLLLRVFLFFFHATAVVALLPLLARRLAGGAGTYALLMACMGAGAITVALFLPAIRRRVTGPQLIMAGALLSSTTALTMALIPDVRWAMVAMFLLGASWLSTSNSLGVSVQMALPDWVRARGYSIYQMCMMGGTAIGAAAWGQVASLGGIDTSLCIAAVTGLSGMFLAHRFVHVPDAEEDLTPAPVRRNPVAVEVPEGEVVVTIEYIIDPQHADAFLAVMRESRRSRLRQGARHWSVMHDIAQPGRFVEQFTDDSWTEHLRRSNRISVADIALRDRRLAFHLPPHPPVATRWVIARAHD